jgi:hypothetical protein
MNLPTYRILLSALALLIMTSCATPPGKIEGLYFSPSIYADYSCSQINEERRRIISQVNRLTSQQSKKATTDTLAVVGGIIFWPAFFLLAVDSDKESQLASAKGYYEAATSAGIKKNCFVG